MPELPRYNAKESISTGQPLPFKSGAAERYGAVEKTLDVVQDVAVKWDKAFDTMQYTIAQNNYKVGVADIESRAAADPDYNNSADYYKELEDVKQASLKGITKRSVQEKASMDFDFENQLSKIKIDNLYRKKMLNVNQAAVMSQLDMLQQKRANAETKEGKALVDEEIKSLIGVQVAAGVYDSKKGYELIGKTIEDSKQLERVQEKEEKRIKNEAMVQDRFETAIKITTMTDEQIYALGKEKMGTDPKQGEALVKRALGQEGPEDEANELFWEVASQIVSKGTAKEISDFLTGALADPNISRDRISALYNAAVIRRNELNKNKNEDSKIRGVMNKIIKFNIGSPSIILANILGKLFGDKDPDEDRLSEITNEEIRKQSMTDNSARIRVKVKGTGQIGTIPEDEFNESIYIKLGK